MTKDTIADGIFLGSKSSGEKNLINIFLTSDFGQINVMEFSTAKKGSLITSLFSKYKLYLYKSNRENLFTLRDVEKKKDSCDFSKVLNFDDICFLMKIIKIFSQFQSKDFYFSIDNFLNFVGNNKSLELSFINLLENLFYIAGFPSDYNSCLICGEKFKEDEILGYNFEASSAVCENCSDIYPFLSSKTRIFLSNFNIDSHEDEKTISKALAFEKERLKYFLKNSMS